MNDKQPNSSFRLVQLLALVTLIAALLAGYKLFHLFGVLAMYATIAVLRLLVCLGSETRAPMWQRVMITWPGTACGYLAVALWFLFSYGPIDLPTSCPREMTQMERCCNGRAVRAFGLGSFESAEFVWSMTVDSDLLERLETEMQFQRIQSGDVPQEFWHRFPGLWQVRPTSRSLYFATSPRGGSYEPSMLAVYQPDRNKIFVWYIRQ